MKTKLFLFLLISFFLRIEAQSDFGKFVISYDHTGGVYGILEKDLDNDGDMDFMSASKVDNTLAYFINDGTGNFSQTIITDDFKGASFIDGADFDNDGDIDFVATGNSMLSWFENDNGNFVEHSIETDLDEPIEVRVYDIGSLSDPETPDGDIDIGLLISGENAAKIYINDGSNNFSPYTIISINSPKYLSGGDFNGDGKEDILITSYNNNEIHWYKVGLMGFEDAGTIASNFSGAFGVEGGDLDGDGDDDVIATAFLNNEVAWFENDGNANFTKHIIDASLVGASFLRWKDIDNDGDKDIIVTGFEEQTGQVVIYYNDGMQNFTKKIIDNTERGPATFCLADFNGDSTIDVIYAANKSGRIVMLGQGVTGSVSKLDSSNFRVYPNPVKSIIHIQTNQPINYIDIFDITGRKVLTSKKLSIPIERFNKGYYLLQVHLLSGELFSHKILVK